MPQVLLVEPLLPECEAFLAREVDVRHATAWDEETLVRECAAADAIVIRAKGRLSARVIDAAPRLRVIGRHGVGVDHIDVVAARRRGIQVVNTPTANVTAAAEFTVGLMLALSRKIPAGDQLVRAGGPWQGADRLLGFELAGKTLGVIGMGRIGQAVARMCGLGFNMPVVYFDYRGRRWSAPAGISARPATLEELLSVADVVTLHVPAVEGTRHLIDARRLGLMRERAVIVNTARGSVVDEGALIEALGSGRIAGAALDVMAREPLVDSPLQTMTNVVLTPHMAAYAREAFVAMGAVVEDVLKVLRGEPPTYAVT